MVFGYLIVMSLQLEAAKFRTQAKKEIVFSYLSVMNLQLEATIFRT